MQLAVILCMLQLESAERPANWAMRLKNMWYITNRWTVRM